MINIANSFKMLLKEWQFIMLQGTRQCIRSSCQNKLIIILSCQKHKCVVLGAASFGNNIAQSFLCQFQTFGFMQSADIDSFVGLDDVVQVK